MTETTRDPPAAAHWQTRTGCLTRSGGPTTRPGLRPRRRLAGLGGVGLASLSALGRAARAAAGETSHCQQQPLAGTLQPRPRGLSHVTRDSDLLQLRLELCNSK